MTVIKKANYDMDINLELYKFFCEVAKYGNFTKAAGRLYVSQSAVSQAIMQLEERLGCKLFDRNTRGVQLTTEGEVLYSYAENAVSLIKNAQDKIANMKSLRDGEIKIGASDTVCSLFLLPFLDKFNRAYPEIRINQKWIFLCLPLYQVDIISVLICHKRFHDLAFKPYYRVYRNQV